MADVSENEIYEDDFECSFVDSSKEPDMNASELSPTDSSSPRLLSYVTSRSSSVGKNVVPGGKIQLPEYPVTDTRGTSSSAVVGGKSSSVCSQHLIGYPGKRDVQHAPVVGSEDSTTMHVSKVTSVTKLEPQLKALCYGGNVAVDNVNNNEKSLSNVMDPYSGTAGPSEPRRNYVLSASSSRSPTADQAVEQCPAVTPQKEPRKRLASSGGRISGSRGSRQESSRSHSQTRFREDACSDVISKLKRGGSVKVDVWKRPCKQSPRNSLGMGKRTPKGKGGSNTSDPQVRKRSWQSSRTILPPLRAPKNTFSVRNEKEVQWHRQQNVVNNSRAASKGGKKPASPSQSDSTGKTTVVLSPSARCQELQKMIVETKDELASLRRARQELDISSRGSQKSSQKTRSPRKQIDVDRLERENEYLRRVLELREKWAKSIDLPLRIAEEELKYALDELERIKKRRRDLWTEDRKASILFTEIMKDHQPAREKVSRQYREGMYNRLALETKVNALQGKLDATQETSNYLSARINELEKRMEADGVAHMKPDEYNELHDAVENNMKTIDRLNAALVTTAGKWNQDIEGDSPQQEEDVSRVRFPGREQMETLIMKLIKKIEQKESQINVLRQRFSRAGSMVQKGRKSTIQYTSLRQSIMKNKRASVIKSRSVSERILQKDDPVTPQCSGNKPSPHSIHSLVNEESRGGSKQQQQDQKKKKSSDMKRIIETRQPASALVKLDSSPPERSVGLKGESAPIMSVSSMTSNTSSEAARKVAIDDVKKRVAAGPPNGGNKSDAKTSLNNNPAADGPGDATGNSHLRLSLIQFGQSDSSRAAALTDDVRSSMDGKDDAVEAKESSRKTPPWLR